MARRIGVELPARRYDTVGGYLHAALNRTPRVGAAVEVGGYRLTVDSVDGRRVGLVTVARLTAPDPELGPA